MSPRREIEEMPALNLTSMIDVLFLLIIFFVVGTKFIESERQIELQLPRVKPGDALTAAPEKKVINVYRDGQITLDRHDVSLEELGQKLTAARAQYQALGVLVRGDGAASFERAPMKLCQRSLACSQRSQRPRCSSSSHCSPLHRTRRPSRRWQRPPATRRSCCSSRVARPERQRGRSSRTISWQLWLSWLPTLGVWVRPIDWCTVYRCTIRTDSALRFWSAF